jgi:hypothetical protein
MAAISGQVFRPWAAAFWATAVARVVLATSPLSTSVAVGRRVFRALGAVVLAAIRATVGVVAAT